MIKIRKQPLEIAGTIECASSHDLRGRVEMTDWKISLKATLIGAVVGTAFGVAGFLFLTPRHQGMGEVLFLLVPVMAGVSVGLFSRGRNSAATSGLLAVLSSLGILIATGKEGVVCAVLALPIILAGLSIGLGLGLRCGGCSLIARPSRLPRWE
jgi:hypothetical protein